MISQPRAGWHHDSLVTHEYSILDLLILSLPEDEPGHQGMGIRIGPLRNDAVGFARVPAGQGSKIVLRGLVQVDPVQVDRSLPAGALRLLREATALVSRLSAAVS